MSNQSNRTYKTISEAYLGTLEDIYLNPDCVSEPRGQRVREKFNYQFTITEPKVEYIVTKDDERNKVIKEYSDKEFELYESQSNRVEDFEKASKFWTKLANPDGTVNSAYGYLIWENASHGCDFETELKECYPQYAQGEESTGTISVNVPVRRTPWQWAHQALVDDKDSRQAILRFSLPEHQWRGNKDQTCTMHGVFSIRNNELNLTITMRSNDMTLGLVYDLPWFISLMYSMVEDLSDVYPDLKIGSYTHYVHNMHVYDRDEARIKKMLGTT